MEILFNFGFEPILFFGQIVNFVVIYIILKKYMYKPLLKTIESRRNKISKGLKDAEEAEQRLADATQKEERVLKSAHERAKKIVDEAKIENDKILTEAEENARKKAESILEEAKAQIAHETSQAEKRLELKVSNLAVSFLENSLKGLFGTKEQEAIMKNALIKMKGKQISE